MNEFARRTKTYVLRELLTILINNYKDRYLDVVKCANKHFDMSFELDCQVHELIDPIKQILKNQQFTCEHYKTEPARMKPFLKTVIGDLFPKI